MIIINFKEQSAWYNNNKRSNKFADFDFATFPRTFRNRIDFTDDSFLVDAVNLYSSQSISTLSKKLVLVKMSVGKGGGAPSQQPLERRQIRMRSDVNGLEGGWVPGLDRRWVLQREWMPYLPPPPGATANSVVQLHFCFSCSPFFVHKSSIIPR